MPLERTSMVRIWTAGRRHYIHSKSG